MPLQRRVLPNRPLVRPKPRSFPFSIHAVGVEINLELGAGDGVFGGKGVAGGADEAVEAVGASGEHAEVPAVFFLDAADGRGRGPEEFQAVEAEGVHFAPDNAVEHGDGAFGAAGVFAFDGEVGEPAVGGVAGVFAFADLARVERGVVVPGRGDDGVDMGI